MIISASYKTDIPTFYHQWFRNRLRAGYCKMVNSYNRRAYHVRLDPEVVEGFVFWTKNIGPFFPALEDVQAQGSPFTVQYTINNYPRILEFSVVDAKRSIEHMKQLSHQYGPKVAVWRYDTIVFSSKTPIDFHRRNFEQLARDLEGTTDEVVISFAHFYQKTQRNMDWAAKEFGFHWEDPPADVKFGFTAELVQIAQAHGMQLAVCSQSQYLAPGAVAARCVDARRLTAVSGRPLKTEIKGNRPDCMCYAARDIGEYNTCPHGCVYCYAVLNRSLAQKNFKQHDPEGEFLFRPDTALVEDDSPDDLDLIQGKLLP